MDVKFRKLISRLSIKERMRSEKNLSGCSDISGESRLENQNLHLVKPTDSDDIKNESDWNSDCITTTSPYNGNRFVLIPHPVNYCPERNILTQIQFPCPTLLRKNKCNSITSKVQMNYAMIEESFYEELKPKSPILTMEPDEIMITTPEVIVEVLKSSPEIIDDVNSSGSGSDTAEVVDDNGNSNIYINLQELEQERRLLIAAQCVRTKYSENWIDDQQVDGDSIVGNNREKTKIYWEAQMRKEQSEKNRVLSKYWNNNAPSSDLIIQKMNAEIEELHRREKELKKKKVEAEDEEDVFSSNTSSVDEFENSESPRLESGFYSNVGEDESIASPELLKEVTVNGNRSLTESPVIAEVDNNGPLSAETPRADIFVQESFQHESAEAGEPESSPKKFTFQKETPIEREIRLAGERDNEHRMSRLSSSTSNLSGNVNEFVVPMPASPVTKDNQTVKQPKPAVRSFSTSAVVNNEEKAAVTSTTISKPRDIQYIMATERLKKEIQEAKEREEELKSREQNYVPVTSTKKSYVPSYVEPLKTEPVKTFVNRFEIVEKRKPKLSTSISNEIVDSLETTPERRNSTKESSPEVQVNGLSSTNNVTVNVTNNLQETKPQSELIYSAFGRPKFNSIERYLLKSSLNLRIGKNFQLPTAASIFESDSVVMEENKTEEEEEVPPTPRKRLIRAQDKIDQELKDMREREKEFALRRAFKSTPDLSQENHEDEEEKIARPVVLRENRNDVAAEVSELKERRRSTLINQWEEKIQGGN